MKHGSLFSGIGGFDLASEWMGWENIFHCEINPFGQKILKYYWPNAIMVEDIKKFKIEYLWQKFVLSVKNPNAPQEDHIANNVILNEQNSGESLIEIATEKIVLNGVEEKNLRFSNTTEALVFVAENLRWNFSLLTIREIMEMQRGGFINHKHGNLLLNEDFLTIIKSYALTAIMQELITEFAHILQKYDVDIISAGFPCQPFSAAGKRKGTDDDRYLWPETIRVIREFQPRYVVGENVRGLTNWNGGLVFDQVQADLEVQGYEVLPFLLPACAVNAPHRRDRIWFVAYCHNWRERRTTIERGWTEHKQQRGEIRSEFTTSGESGITPDPRLQRQEKSEQQTAGIEQCGEESATNSESVRSDRAQEHENRDRQSGKRRRCDTHNTGEIQERNIIANTNSRRQSGKEHRQAEPGFTSETSLPNNWRNFPTESPLCSRNDGLSTRLDNITFSKWRNESIKGYGNAIVPNIAYQIFKAIEQHQNLTP